MTGERRHATQDGKRRRYRQGPRAPGELWGPDFMHRQALEVLPALLDALGVDCAQQPPWLLGHSDGGSIALLYAAHFPTALAGAVVLAPHILLLPPPPVSAVKFAFHYLLA